MHGLSSSEISLAAVAEPVLLPGQSAQLARLHRAVKAIPVVAVIGPHGMGRTTVLRHLARDIDADFIDMRRIAQAVRAYPVMKTEEVVLDMIQHGLDRYGTVVFDGYSEFVLSATNNPRERFFYARMQALLGDAIAAGRRLILGGNVVHWWGGLRSLFGEFASQVRCDPLMPEDYAAFFQNRFGPRVAGVDFQLLHGLAPQLNLHQLSYLANRLECAERIDFDVVRGLIEAEVIGSNLRLDEVEELRFDSLPGSEEIARVLETHVVLPFERPDLAKELGLKPRRGVLLYGPPGTGKTSIGRALAHRMKGRFFLIDGSFITEPPLHFFAKIDAIVARAKANAPSVLFIDDADVLFQIGHVQGLARYLLSLLDGVESRSASEVCIVLTAMDAAKLPAALLRSGRVELWLETRAPDLATRARILDRWVPRDMVENGGLDLGRIAQETDGFTPADLRRLAGDAKLFFAADLAAGRPPKPGQHYFERAVADLGELRAVMDRRLGEENAMARYYA